MRTRHIVELIHRREAAPDLSALERRAAAGDAAAAADLDAAKQAFVRFGDCRDELEQTERQIRACRTAADEHLEQIAQLRTVGDPRAQEALAHLQQQYDRADRELQQHSDRRRRLQQQLAEEAAAIRERVPEFLPTARELEFADIAALAGEGEALVAFSVTRRGTAVFVLTDGVEALVPGESLFWFDAFTRARLRQLLFRKEDGEYKGWLAALRSGATTRNAHELAELGRALYRELFVDIDRSLRRRGVNSIVFVLGGDLALCPLHLMEIADALDDDGIGPVYLGDRYRISYAPSFQVLAICRRRGGRGMRKVGGIADPTQDLAFASVEAEAIEHELASTSVEVGFAKRAAATLARTIPLLSQEGVLHFSCHGKFHFLKPLKSCLLLAPEGGEDDPASAETEKGRDTREWVFAERSGERVVLVEDGNGRTVGGYFERGGDKHPFAPLTLERILAESQFSDNALVVLSACEVGLVDLEGVGEAVGFPAAFLCGGAPIVLSGLWPVEDVATCLLMQHFFHHLAEGRDNVEALRLAQRRVRTATGGEILDWLDERQQQLRDVSPQVANKVGLRRNIYDNAYSADQRPFAGPLYWGAFYVSGEVGAVYDTGESAT